MSHSHPNNQNFLIIGDSHIKHIPTHIFTNHFHIVTRSISGLRWLNPRNPQLCVYHLVTQSDLSSFIDTISNILFIVGTNSVRNLPAPQVITELHYLLNYLYTRYPHLNSYNKIMIAKTFQCLKPSYAFPNVDLLQHNITLYNDMLVPLSHQYHFMPIAYMSNLKLEFN
ncbi:unnamed protein product [Rotaria magnacalcarata]|uniref:Uncharacterized protein n=1 Tax=Rotaria magnacalcarata TaxID=392030 RepID=A0A816PRD5_9BILA|nr:unnamed protein product [Rotaria magnacalcarata]CAF5158099.1 unnamed protein product [Rotaria magnacalcarata]